MIKRVSKKRIKKSRKSAYYAYFDAYKGLIGIEKVPPTGDSIVSIRWPNLAAVVVPLSKRGRLLIGQLETCHKKAPIESFALIHLASLSGAIEFRIPENFENLFDSMADTLLENSEEEEIHWFGSPHR